MKKLDINKKTIIFDFDGTIADTFEHLLDLLDQYSGDFGVEISDTKLLEDLRSLPSDELFKKLGIPKWLMPFIVYKVQKKFGETINTIYPFTDVKGILPDLAENYNLGIVTSNSSSNVIKFLKKENLTNYFCFVYGSLSLFGKHKILNNVISKYALTKNAVVYVGDESRDFDAGTKAGIKVISVGWGFNSANLLKKVNSSNYIESPFELPIKVKELFSI